MPIDTRQTTDDLGKRDNPLRVIGSVTLSGNGREEIEKFVASAMDSMSECKGRSSTRYQK